jgi:hypothetical protein
MEDMLILHGNCIFMLTTSRTLPVVLQFAHTAAHEGVQKTLHCLRLDFIIDHDHPVVSEFVLTYIICQKNKTKELHPTGLL